MTCPEEDCKFQSLDPREIMAHAAQQHQIRLVPCFVDGCNGSLQQNIKKHHVRIHSKETECYFCPKSLQTYNRMRVHQDCYHQLYTGLFEPSNQELALANEVRSKSLRKVMENFADPNDYHIILVKKNYIVNYDEAKMRPLWSFEFLSKDFLNPFEDGPEKVVREQFRDYKEDSELPFRQLQKNSIPITFVHGHLAAAGNYPYSKEDMEETFCMSNIAPMAPTINNKLWRSLENHARAVARKRDVLVFSIPIYNDNVPPMDVPGGVPLHVPTAFAKIVYIESTKILSQIFIIPNREPDQHTSYWKYMSTFEKICASTGFNFTNVPLTWDWASTQPYYRCSRCCLTFLEKPQLLEHMVTHKERFFCGICEKKCLSNEALEEHVRSHESYKCSICEAEFTRKYELARHQKTHQESRPYLCVYCGLAFRSENVVKAHEKTHSEVKGFQCTMCDYATKTQYCLTNHMKKKHPAIPRDRPFVCGVCNKRYLKKSNLISHERTHTGEKPYKCDYCEYATTSSDVLKNHVKRLHPDKSSSGDYDNRKYVCSTCDLRFWTRNELECHENLHQKKFFPCKHCSFGSTTKPGLARHCKLRHGTRKESTGSTHESKSDRKMDAASKIDKQKPVPKLQIVTQDSDIENSDDDFVPTKKRRLPTD